MPNTAPQRSLIPRDEHTISRSNISKHALKVLYRLKEAGYRACLVGGGVRDLLLGLEPKDFDVATDATPEQVRELFRNCRVVGRRFRLAHILFGREIIEVATFRAGHDGGDEFDEDEDDRALSENGRILRDNVYGSIEEDARRRDFTVNALYYDIADFSVQDFVGGMEDLRAGRLHLIGDAETRYREDPVRMLRAVRFAVKLGFTLYETTADAIPRLAHLLEEIAPARLFEEVLKLFQAGFAVQTFEALRHYGLFGRLFPLTEACLAQEEQGFPITLVAGALASTDRRVAEGKPVTPAFLFAALLWEPVRQRAQRYLDEDAELGEIPALQRAAAEVSAAQARHTTLPKRFSLPMREIWALQPRFDQRGGRRAARLLSHPRFRAAYDFLVLRAEHGEVDPELAAWWTRFQEVDEAERQAMMAAVGGGGGGARKSRRRRRRPKRRSADTPSQD